MGKKVLIISLEGIESNTEINFFNGLSHWLTNMKLKSNAVGKVSSQTNKKALFTKRIKILFHRDPKLLEFNVFFIGDSDVSKDIESMERSVEIFNDIWVGFGGDSSLLNLEIIFPGSNMGFDELLTKISPKHTRADWKKGKTDSNHNLFNNFAGKAGWIDGDHLNKDKIKVDLKKFKTDYIKLFDFIVK